MFWREGGRGGGRREEEGVSWFVEVMWDWDFKMNELIGE